MIVSRNVFAARIWSVTLGDTELAFVNVEAGKAGPLETGLTLTLVRTERVCTSCMNRALVRTGFTFVFVLAASAHVSHVALITWALIATGKVLTEDILSHALV